MRLEELPLQRNSSDERDFEMDEETDYLLQPPTDARIKMMNNRRKRSRQIYDCTKLIKFIFCG